MFGQRSLRGPVCLRAAESLAGASSAKINSLQASRRRRMRRKKSSEKQSRSICRILATLYQSQTSLILFVEGRVEERKRGSWGPTQSFKARSVNRGCRGNLKIDRSGFAVLSKMTTDGIKTTSEGTVMEDSSFLGLQRFRRRCPVTHA